MKEKKSFRYFYDVYIYGIFMNIFSLNFIPLIIFSIMFFLIRFVSHYFFEETNFNIFVGLFLSFYYFILHPGYLIISNFLYAINNNKKYYVINILLILCSAIFGYVFYFINKKIILGYIFLNNDWHGSVFLSAIVSFELILLLVVGVIEQIIIILKYSENGN
jgi:hypothetical protein